MFCEKYDQQYTVHIDNLSYLSLKSLKIICLKDTIYFILKTSLIYIHSNYIKYILVIKVIYFISKNSNFVLKVYIFHIKIMFDKNMVKLISIII